MVQRPCVRAVKHADLLQQTPKKKIKLKYGAGNEHKRSPVQLFIKTLYQRREERVFHLIDPVMLN